MSGSVLYHSRDGVATVTLNRPAALNALDTETKQALREAVTTAATDARVRAVVLTGAGKAFCVGQDLREHADHLAQDPVATWRTLREHYNPITLALATMAKPVVAAVNGVAAGAGAAFAFACDFRVLDENARFNLAFAAVGLTADSGASWTLPRLVGHAKATELLMLSETVNAAQARELGLATKVVAAGTSLAAATELAGTLAAGATVALAAVKTALAYAAGHPIAESLAREEELQRVAGTSADHADAVNAFLAKRPPVFHGR